MTPTPNNSDTSTATTAEPVITTASVQTKIDTATATVQTAVTNAETSVTTLLPTPAIAQAVAAVPEVVQAVTTATTKIEVATTAIAAAQTAVDSATATVQAVDSQTAVVATATTAVDSATAVVATAIQAVDSQTAVVAVDTTAVATATTALQVATTLPANAITYTTPGYVAPVAPAVPTVTTTVLPAMGDDAAKITTPFDIKMGTTVFEGQGTASQIYVSPKGIISFGGKDYTYWDWPNMKPNGIYVFQSDFMSSGKDAKITVTTTETTLSVDWDVHRWGDSQGPLTNMNWDMTVNPTTGEWTGIGTMSGNTNVYGGPRSGVRQDGVLTQLTAVTNTQKEAIVATATTTLATAQTTLTTDTAVLATVTEAKTTAVTVLATAQSTLTTETQTLTNLQSTSSAAVTTANTLADAAIVKANEAKTALETATTTVSIAASQYVAAQLQLQAQKDAEAAALLKAQQEAAAAAEAARLAAEAAAAAASSTPPAPPAQEIPVSPSPSEPPTVPQINPENPIPQPEPAPEVAPETAPEPPVAVPDPAPVEEPQPAPGPDVAPSPEEIPTPQPDPAPEPEKPSDPQPEPVSPMPAPEPTPAPAPEPPAVIEVTKDTTAETWKPAVAPEEYLTKAEIKSYEAIGLVPNNPTQLPTDIPKPAPAEALVPHEQVDVKGVENGGIQFFGTQDAPQVVGEDGKLTPPAPAPGSGDPIPPDAITTTDTFIGQPGGTTFNAPDIAVPVVLVPVELPAALDVLPGVGAAAQAVNQAYVALANIGNDMSPVTRKKAKKILIITVAVAAIRRRFN